MPVPANYRWLFEDPVAVTSYRLPLNPNRMTSPYPTHQLEALGNLFGRFRTRRTPTPPFEWMFSGVIRDQDHHDALLEWSLVSNEINITDHLGRQWEVLPQNFKSNEDRPSARIPDKYDYEFIVLMLRRLA